jgi:hypothetical protein
VLLLLPFILLVEQGITFFLTFKIITDSDEIDARDTFSNTNLHGTLATDYDVTIL